MCELRELQEKEILIVEGGKNYGTVIAGYATGVAGLLTLATGGGALVAGVCFYCGLLQVADGLGF